MAKAGENASGNNAAPSLAELFAVIWSWLRRNRRFAGLIAAAAVLLSLVVTLLVPRDFVATMVVTPVESSLTDPSSLMTTPGFSIRAPLSFSNNAPPQMAAFIKLLKSPEVARKLARDPRAMQAIRDAGAGWLGAILSDGAPQDDAAQTDRVLKWLTYHVSVDQDVDVQTWTINLRHPNSADAIYLLTTMHACAEDILRAATITQFQKEKEYGISFLNTTTDAQEKQIIYGILGSIDRSLLVLRSGANVATIVISSPYAPANPTYPRRIALFLVVLGGTAFILFAALLAYCYRSLRRGDRAASHGLAAAAADI